MATIEMSAKLNPEKDITMLVIKPEPLADGRASGIIKWVESFCEENSLRISEYREFVMTRAVILDHYSGEGKLVEVGKKVMGSIRMGSSEKRARAEAAGLTQMPLEELGRAVMMTELNDYTGKKAVALTIVGEGALSKIRSARGASDPSIAVKSDPINHKRGTIRGDFTGGMNVVDMLLGGKPPDNIVHVPLDYKELSRELGMKFGTTPDQELAKAQERNMDLIRR